MGLYAERSYWWGGGGRYKEEFRKEASLVSEMCHAHVDNQDCDTNTEPAKRQKWPRVLKKINDGVKVKNFMRPARKKVAKFLEVVLSLKEFLIWWSHKTPSRRNTIVVNSISLTPASATAGISFGNPSLSGQHPCIPGESATQTEPLLLHMLSYRHVLSLTVLFLLI